MYLIEISDSWVYSLKDTITFGAYNWLQENHYLLAIANNEEVFFKSSNFLASKATLILE